MRRLLRPLLLIATACSHDATGPRNDVPLGNGLTVRAESSVVDPDVGPSVQVLTIFTNRSKSPVSNDVSECVVRLRVTRVADGAVVLDEARSNIDYICDPRTVILVSGAADTAVRRVIIPAVGARFHMESVLRTSTGTLSVDAGTVKIQ